jgi:hypothetical protein
MTAGTLPNRYVPQLLLNMQRRSTDGWNIDNVLLSEITSRRFNLDNLF